MSSRESSCTRTYIPMAALYTLYCNYHPSDYFFFPHRHRHFQSTELSQFPHSKASLSLFPEEVHVDEAKFFQVILTLSYQMDLRKSKEKGRERNAFTNPMWLLYSCFHIFVYLSLLPKCLPSTQMLSVFQDLAKGTCPSELLSNLSSPCWSLF